MRDSSTSRQLCSYCNMPYFVRDEGLTCCHWLCPLQVAHSSSVTVGTSKQTHLNEATRANQAACIHAPQKTHLHRKSGPLRTRTKYSTSIADLEAIGLWALKTFTKCYGSLPAATALANVADFTCRELYYLVRGDLHPHMVPRFAKMLEDSPFGTARDMLPVVSEVG